MKPLITNIFSKIKCCSLAAKVGMGAVGGAVIGASAVAIPVAIISSQPEPAPIVEEVAPEEEVKEPEEVKVEEPTPEPEPETTPTVETPKPTPTTNTPTQPTTTTNNTNQGTPLTPHNPSDELPVTEERCHIEDGFFLCYRGEGTKEDLDQFYDEYFSE